MKFISTLISLSNEMKISQEEMLICTRQKSQINLVYHKLNIISACSLEYRCIFIYNFQVKRYICGSLRQSFLAYGPSGTGKTSFLARVAFVAGKVLNLITCVHFCYWLNVKVSSKIELIICFYSSELDSEHVSLQTTNNDHQIPWNNANQFCCSYHIDLHLPTIVLQP